MTDSSRDETTDASDLGRPSPFKPWVGREYDRPLPQPDPERRCEFCDKWAPRCPDGNPQRLRRALGFRERNIRELELRVPLGGNDGGVCQVVVDERPAEVYVRVLVCCRDDRTTSRDEELDCPVRVWLEQPLGERAVIDVDNDEELRLYTPKYVGHEVQPDHGYRRVFRRRRDEWDPPPWLYRVDDAS
jgi:hypothetical protein